MLQKFINFDSMITPTIIKVLFWVGVAVSGIVAIMQIITGVTMIFSRWESGGVGFMLMIGGLIIFAVGILFSRIYCELLIVIFKMQESLNAINEKIKKD